MGEGRIAEAVQRLAGEPLYALSMSSRELFHSNFIAWLIEEHQTAGFALVGELFGHPGDPIQVLRVEREKQHVDLHIHSFSGEDIWIEMKVGAIPTDGQLRRYHDVLARPGVAQRFWLVSLMPPPALPHPWDVVSLRQLAAALAEVAPLVEDPFARDLVTHEADLLGLLDRVGTEVDPITRADETWAFTPATARAIKAGRATTLVEKARMGAVVNHLRQEYPGEDLQSAAGLTRGTGLVEFRRFLADGRSVGWQLQGNQYRLFGQSAIGTSAHVLPAELGRWSEEWFTFGPAEDALSGLHLGPRASGAGVYGTEFRYQYRQLPGDATNRQVLDLLHSETQRLGSLAF